MGLSRTRSRTSPRLYVKSACTLAAELNATDGTDSHGPNFSKVPILAPGLGLWKNGVHEHQKHVNIQCRQTELYTSALYLPATSPHFEIAYPPPVITYTYTLWLASIMVTNHHSRKLREIACCRNIASETITLSSSFHKKHQNFVLSQNTFWIKTVFCDRTKWLFAAWRRLRRQLQQLYCAIIIVVLIGTNTFSLSVLLSHGIIFRSL